MTPSSSISQDSQLTTQDAPEALRPPLKDAMGSLNINLEYELARYRHAKQGSGQAQRTFPAFPSRRQRSLNLMSVPGSAAQAGASSAQVKMPPMPPPNPRISQAATPDRATDPSAQSSSECGTDSIEDLSTFKGALVQQATVAEEAPLASSESLFESFASETAASYPDSQPESKRWSEWLSTPLGLGTLLLLLVGSSGLGFILVNPYAARNLISNTPLVHLWPTPPDEAEMGEATASGEELGEETLANDFPLGELSPDLSEREFSDLDLNSLSNLPSNSSPVERSSLPGIADTQNAERSAAANPAATRGSTPAAETPTPSPAASSSQRVNEIPRTTTPAPQPAAAVPAQESYQAPATPAPQSEPTSAVTTQPSPSASTEYTQPSPPVPADASGTPEPVSREPASSYYVVSDYTGDPSLESAREVVDDAYVRNFETGARIQLGAFNSEEGAAALAEELKEQGIEAQIYEPQN